MYNELSFADDLGHALMDVMGWIVVTEDLPNGKTGWLLLSPDGEIYQGKKKNESYFIMTIYREHRIFNAPRKLGAAMAICLEIASAAPDEWSVIVIQLAKDIYKACFVINAQFELPSRTIAGKFLNLMGSGETPEKALVNLALDTLAARKKGKGWGRD